MNAGTKLARCSLFPVGLFSLGLIACDPTLTVGYRNSAGDTSEVPGTGGMNVAGTTSSGMGGAGTAGSPSSALAGAGGSPAPTALLWSTDHETGDLSDWEEGGALFGGTYTWNVGVSMAVMGVARSGQYSLRLDIETLQRGAGARVYRALAPEPAYYSAWFYLDQRYTPNEWWSVFIINASTEPGGLSNTTSLWELRIVEQDGDLRLSFFDSVADRSLVAADTGTVPIAQWFHVEAYVHYDPPSASVMRVWMNGIPILDEPGLGGEPEGTLIWVLGNGADQLTPNPSSLYVDDAAIATGRLGP